MYASEFLIFVNAPSSELVALGILSSGCRSNVLPKPLPHRLWPAEHHEKRERGAPVRPSLDKIPNGHTHERAKERGPESPNRHPEKKNANGTNEYKDCHRNIHKSYNEQELCRKRGVRYAKLRKPPHPILLALQGEDAMSDKLSRNRDAKYPLRFLLKIHKSYD